MSSNKKNHDLMKKGIKDLVIKMGIGAGPTLPTNPLKGKQYTVDKRGNVQFKNAGGKVSKYYAACGANIITGRD